MVLITDFSLQKKMENEKWEQSYASKMMTPSFTQTQAKLPDPP